MRMDEFYRTFRPIFLKRTLPERSRIMARHALARGGAQPRIADIGCGSGWFGQALRAEANGRPYHLTGIEIGGFVDGSGYDEVLHATIEDPWPFDDGAVDVVYMGAVLEHIFDYHAQMNEANRVLRDGGLFLFDVPNLGGLRDTLQLVLRRQPSWLREMQHVHGFTLSFLRTLSGRHGFRVLSAEADGFAAIGARAPRWLRRLLATWGSCLCIVARKVRAEMVVDGRVAHVFHGTPEFLDLKTARITPRPR